MNLVYSIFVIFMLFPVYFCKRKAQAARLDCEGDGASDVKALLALQEEAKPPNNLAAGARQ
ncbi:hypothetical protein [Bacillus cereus]